MPKIRKILKNAGNGNSKLIYPHFLPLLSKLNQEQFGDKVLKFYQDFFEHFKIGLCTKLSENQIYCRSDINAISSSYFECIRYVLIQLQISPIETPDPEINSRQFSFDLLKINVIDVIRFLLMQTSSANGKYVIIHLVDLIQFLNENCGRNTIYNDLLNYFWLELFTTIEASLKDSTSDKQMSQKLDIIHDLINHLAVKSTNKETIKTSKVRFSDHNEIDLDKNSEVNMTEPIRYFEKELNDLAIRLCQFYIRKTCDSVCDTFVEPLRSLLMKFGSSQDFYTRLAGSPENMPKLYDKFASWLLLKEIRSDNVLDITLMLYPHLNVSERSKLLYNLIRFPNEDVKNWTLSRIMSHPLCTDTEVIRLISHPLVTKQIMKNAENLTNWNTNECINLLHKCFFQTENGDMLIDDETCRKIIEIFCNVLADQTVDPSVLDACVSFLVQIMPLFCSDKKKQSIRNEIFTKLFALSVDKDRLSSLGEDTQWGAMTSWQDALSSNDIDLDENLLEICAMHVEQVLVKVVKNENTNIDIIEAISETVSKLILCSIEHLENDDEMKYNRADIIIETIFKRFQNQIDNYFRECLRACTFFELVDGNITTTPTVIDCLDDEFGTLDAYQCANVLLKLAIFKFYVTFQITCSLPIKFKNTEKEKALDDENTEDYFDLNEILLKKWSNVIYKEIFDAVYAGSLFSTLIRYFNVSI